MTSITERYLPLIVMTILATACSSSERVAAGRGSRVIDSAGIQIVMSGTLESVDSLSWSIDSVATLVIGSTGGAEPYIFDRITGFTRLKDGSIAIGDGASEEIRIFDSTGTYLRRFGGKGEGPGEYIYFRGLRPYLGDSLYVTDYEGVRAHVVAPDGRELRRFAPHRKLTEGAVVTNSPAVVGFFSDGTLLIAEDNSECRSLVPATTVSIDAGIRTEPGYCENTSSLYRLREDGTTAAEYGKFLRTRSLTAATNGGRAMQLGSLMPRAFVRQLGDQFFYVDGVSPEIRVFHRDSGLTRIIRFEATRPAKKLVPPKRPERPPGMPAPKGVPVTTDAHFREALAAAGNPEFTHYFISMQIDREGNIWLGESGDAQPGRINKMWVIDSAGTLLAKVIAPPRTLILTPTFSPVANGQEIGRDYILTRGTNSDGVEVVRMHRLFRGRR